MQVARVNKCLLQIMLESLPSHSCVAGMMYHRNWSYSYTLFLHVPKSYLYSRFMQDLISKISLKNKIHQYWNWVMKTANSECISCVQGGCLIVCVSICQRVAHFHRSLKEQYFSVQRWVWKLRLSFRFSRLRIPYVLVLNNETNFQLQKSLWDYQL